MCVQPNVYKLCGVDLAKNFRSEGWQHWQAGGEALQEGGGPDL
jgi:hypothetical protein